MLQAYPKKLESKLGNFEKGYLKAIDDILSDHLEWIFDNYIDEVSTGSSTMDNIKSEVAQEIYTYVESALISMRSEYQVAFIENNHYSIDKNGKIHDDNKEEE